MGYIQKHAVYVKVDREECSRETGKVPMKTGWVETNKETENEPNIMCRWVDKDYN